jgi:hypothetical protein
MSKAWTRDKWGLGNWCAYVAAGTTREDRLDRLDEVPPNFRDEVAAHVRVYFQVRAEARRQEQGKK